MAPKKQGRGRPTLIPQTEKALTQIIRKRGEIQDSLEELAHKTGRSRSVVAAALKGLEEKGIIAVVSTRPKRYIYRTDDSPVIVGMSGKSAGYRRRVVEVSPGTELIIRVRKN